VLGAGVAQQLVQLVDRGHRAVPRERFLRARAALRTADRVGEGQKLDPCGCGVVLQGRAVVAAAIGDEHEVLAFRHQSQQPVE